MRNVMKIALLFAILAGVTGCEEKMDTAKLADLKLCRYAANFFGDGQDITRLDAQLSAFWDEFKNVRSEKEIGRVHIIEKQAEDKIKHITNKIVEQKDAVVKEELQKFYHSPECRLLVGKE